MRQILRPKVLSFCLQQTVLVWIFGKNRRQFRDIGSKLPQLPVEVYSFFNKELQTQALLAPFMQHELNKRTQIPNSKGELVLEHTLRQIMFFTDPVVNINNLTQDQVDTFTSFWTKTIVLKIEDNIRLRFLHFHNYPIDFYPP